MSEYAGLMRAAEECRRVRLESTKAADECAQAAQEDPDRWGEYDEYRTTAGTADSLERLFLQLASEAHAPAQPPEAETDIPF